MSLSAHAPALVSPIRPKVGRLPVSAPAAPKPFQDNERWNARYVVYVTALIGALASITGALVQHHSPHAAVTPELLPVVASHPALTIQAENAHERLVGQVAPLKPIQETEVFSSSGTAETPVDKPDRSRLLTIIGND